MEELILNILEEQLAFEFNGKINILDANSKQFLGSVYLKDGAVWNVTYGNNEGQKALFRLYVDESSKKPISYIVEPELLDKINQNIHYPFSVLKKKLSEKYEEYKLSEKQRPPNSLKLLIKEGFIADGPSVTSEEFETLCVISDYNLVKDIYTHCPLLDHEITMALISLRKKGALKVATP